jgi:hypothetical protein
MPSVDGSHYCKLRACQSPKIQALDSYSVHNSSLSQGRRYNTRSQEITVDKILGKQEIASEEVEKGKQGLTGY